MKANNIKFIAIFLILLFCLVGAVNATEDVTNDTSYTAHDQTVTTETIHEDLSENAKTEPIKKDTDDSVTKKIKKEKMTTDDGQDNITINNKEIKTLTEIPKKESNEHIDFYVSDIDGLDTNDGSQTTPFKTIQTAIDKTTIDKIYNIHILEGTYKGLGNTNLTINGDYKINFIGSGIDKTVIDGDAKFTLPGSGNEAWGGSAFWNNWKDVSGNWFMKITQGTGLINIYNFTIQNCWSNSGSAITLCPTSTIDNYATLNATNIYFNKNHAGNGAGIRNNNGGTLYVDNCTFENGTKAQTTGNFGAAIYNNGTAVITNSNIINNYARWGSVTNDKNITMINCTFKNNHAYDGGSGYKNGPSFTADTGITNYYQMYAVFNLTSRIINCTFEDNEQCDISNGRGDLIVDNCIFNHSTGVYLFPNNNKKNNYLPTQIITNNQFIDMQPSTVFTTTSSGTRPSVAVRSVSTYNVTIENNIIDVKNTEEGYGLYLTANAIAKNNTLNNYIYLNGENNKIINNTIKTTKENTISLTNNAKKAIIANNTLIGGYANGDLSINNILTDTILENNVPKASTYTINDENYATYFNQEGILRNDVVANGSKIIFADTLINKNFIFDNVKVTIDSTTTLINATIVTQNNAKVVFNNLKIDNTKNDKGYVILLESEGNTIKNANIHLVSDKPSQIIKIEADNNTITGTNANNPTLINATIPASDVDWNTGNVPSAGIFIRSSNNLLSFIELHITSLNPESTSSNPTLDGIDIQSKAVGEYVTGNQIKSNKIYVDGGSFVYGLNIARAKNTVTPLSWFYVTSDNYAVGIQIGDSDYNNISGYIYVTANNTAYGFYSTAMSNGITNNTNLAKLYLQNITAPNAVGIKLEGTSNVEISNTQPNTACFTINGEKITAIEIDKDYMDNIPKNILITGLNIKLNGLNDTSSIITIKNAINTTINKNTVKSTKGQGIILTDTLNSIVTNNYINIGDLVGGNFAVKNNTKSQITDNTPTIALLTDETYNNFFNENNTFYIDASILTINGDIHNKVLIFANITHTIDIKNAANYTLYNTTIILAGDSSKSTGSTVSLNIENLNFKNVNKVVFKDELHGTIQKNVYFKNTNIKVTGDNIVTFDAYNNNSYIYLDISNSNINMDGENVVVVNYSGYNHGQSVYITKNKIDVKATKNATILNAYSATIKLNSNEIKMNAKNALTANLNDSTISYYNFKENNIEITAETASVLNMIKYGTSSSYITDNIINIKTSKPTTVFNIIGGSRVYVEDNHIVVDSVNGETPIIYIDSKSSDVEDNYIIANDTYGDNAVAKTGILISGNTPKTAHIALEPEILILTKENTILIKVTNDDNNTITGNLKVTLNNTEIPITDNTIKYTPTTLDDLNITVIYSDPTGTYGTTKSTIKIPVRKILTNIEVTIPNENEINKETPITIILTDEDGNLIANSQVNISSNNGDKILDLTNGVIVYQYTPTKVSEETLIFTYLGNNILNQTTTTKIIKVTNKDAIINEQNNTINNLTNLTQTQNNTINNLTNLTQTQNNTINNLTNLTQTQNNTIQTQTQQINEQKETITKQNNTIQTQTQQINEQKETIKEANNKLSNAEKQTTTSLKTVKATKKTKKTKNFKITATLNKQIKGKYVFVIFNGKTYKAKTNNKGIAKIIIKKTTLQKLAGKKIKYQIISGQKIINKTLKIKK